MNHAIVHLREEKRALHAARRDLLAMTAGADRTRMLSSNRTEIAEVADAIDLLLKATRPRRISTAHLFAGLVLSGDEPSADELHDEMFGRSRSRLREAQVDA